MMHPDFAIQLANDDNERRAARAQRAPEYYESLPQRHSWWARLVHRP